MKLYPVAFILRMTALQEKKLIKLARKMKVSQAQVLRDFLESTLP